MREIHRLIAAVLVLSSDDCILLGRKDPAKGGVYPSVWHLPGGGVLAGETLADAAVREVAEETGLNIEASQLKPIGPIGQGESEKIMPDGEKVLCHMEFHRFEIRMPQTARELAAAVAPGDDLVELRWFPIREMGRIEQIPGAAEFYKEIGYI